LYSYKYWNTEKIQTDKLPLSICREAPPKTEITNKSLGAFIFFATSNRTNPWPLPEEKQVGSQFAPWSGRNPLPEGVVEPQ
jgi:hypothetical protein